MKELDKVRNINISLLDKTTYEPLLDIPCEFGKIIEVFKIIIDLFFQFIHITFTELFIFLLVQHRGSVQDNFSI